MRTEPFPLLLDWGAASGLPPALVFFAAALIVVLARGPRLANVRRGVLKKNKAIPYHEPDEIPQPVVDLLASFRYSAVRQLLDRLRRHQDRRSIGTLAVSGGAAANRLLRRELIRWAEEARVNLRLVPLVFSGDNAAMIAYAALVRGRYGRTDESGHLSVASRIPFS